MPNKAKQAYREWQEADAAARQAESRLAQAWKDMDATGKLPSPQLMAEVSRLRSIANDKLTVAMLAMRGAASQTHPGRKS